MHMKQQIRVKVLIMSSEKASVQLPLGVEHMGLELRREVCDEDINLGVTRE